MRIACGFGMGWKKFTEIGAWQLSMKLKAEFDAILDREPACKDFKFCQDARDAALSPGRNIAEGFGRYRHGEFAQFVRIARGSLLETQTNLIDARNRKLMTPEEFNKLWALSDEATAATTGLLRYLGGDKGGPKSPTKPKRR